MSRSLELKRIGSGAVERALDKADTYRLLNEPGQAESICLDVLAVDPENVRARRTLLLALTDQFADLSSRSKAEEARSLAGKLPTEYERHYYRGLVEERLGRACISRGAPGEFAYEHLEDALGHYEAAEKVRPSGDDDAILRWNACVRSIRELRLSPRGEEGEPPLE